MCEIMLHANSRKHVTIIAIDCLVTQLPVTLSAMFFSVCLTVHDFVAVRVERTSASASPWLRGEL